MYLENWVLSLTACKRIGLKIADSLLARVNLEPIEDETGVIGAKAVWVGNRGQSVVEVNSPSLKGNIKMEGDQPPTVEYWHAGDKRGFALRHPKNIACEFDEKTLRKITSAKAAGIAMGAGALAGLLGWLAVSIVNRAALVKQEAEASSPPLLESKDTSR